MFTRATLSRLGSKWTTGSITSIRGKAYKAMFELSKPYKLHRMTESPPSVVECSRYQALKYYREMVTIRRLEAAANALYKERSVRGFCHLYSGQEAVAVGIENAIT